VCAQHEQGLDSISAPKKGKKKAKKALRAAEESNG
jgi:hypothetical protein